MSVAQFIEDCKKDLDGQGIIFPRHIAQYKTMVCNMDEILDSDKTATHKFKKSVKILFSSNLSHVSNEISYAEIMEKMGSVALSREAETGIGTAFLKLSVITKELANHRKTLCENLNNMVLFPLNSLLKGDMNKIGDMKKPVEESWKEYKSKGMKKDGRKKTSEIVLYRIDPEPNDESERERRQFMYNSCEYLMKANDVKVKKGVELVQHLIDFYQSQLRYFSRGLELLESMRSYFEGLAGELQQLKTEKDEEKKELSDIRNQLKNILQLDLQADRKAQNYKLHGQQGNKGYGGEKCGYLLKRSEGVRKQWQRRYCVIKDGILSLAHSPQDDPTTELRLLTCQVRPSIEKDAGKKLAFALVAHNRTYLFQAEDDADYDAWISVLSNAREEALNKAFGEGEEALNKESVNSLDELTQGIISEVRRLPGNNQCVDCNTFDPTWLSTNLGVLVCIECSGVHRELGVHVTRIRSLTLDKLGTAELLLARAVGNSGFNEIMEAELEPSKKPTAGSKMEVKKDFIQKKYIQKKFYHPSGHSADVLLVALQQAIDYHDILAVLQLYADGVDFTGHIPDCNHNGSAIHYCIEREDLTSLHIVDFIIQNCKNVHVQNSQGNTALHLTAMHNNTECMKLLIRNGAQLDQTNKEGKAALTIAKELGFTEYVDLLQEAIDGKTGQFDHVKIDWGLEETEDIYATPLDLADLKLEVEHGEPYDKKTPLSTSQQQQQHLQHQSTGPLLRSLTSPKNHKTVGHSTPSSRGTTDFFNPRHSMASIPPFTQTMTNTDNSGPPLPEKTHSQSGPPLPPLRKAKPKVAIPPQSGSSSITTGVGPPATSNGPPASSPASSATPVLSTFAPKPGAGSKPSPERSLQQPPEPPTRSSSFIPRGSPNDPTALIEQRLDRPLPPAPAKKGHSRNASDGNVMYQFESNEPDTDRSRYRACSVADNIYSRPSHSIPVDHDAPPLPPPRPKGKNEHSAPITPQTSQQMQQQQQHIAAQAAQAVLQTRSLPTRTSSQKKSEGRTKFRRAKALYDCDADHDDELSFIEGEIIIMIREADPDWWFGEVEGHSERSGVFPISFVHVLNE